MFQCVRARLCVRACACLMPPCACAHGHNRSALLARDTGKIEYCLFDKTGTLTTDKLVCAGTWRPGLDPSQPPSTLADTSKGCALVLGSCHALVQVGEQVMGDPVEMASLQALGWEYDTTSQMSCPGEGSQVFKKGEVTAQVLHRYHFASKLQRMAVLATVREKNAPARHMALVKGSPEVIATLLTSKPDGYDTAYREMAERGMRVLALASRPLTSAEEDAARRAATSGRGPAREDIEAGLHFEGFVAFVCKVRRDTAEVVGNLQQSSVSRVKVPPAAFAPGRHARAPGSRSHYH